MFPNPDDPESPLINIAGVVAIAAQEDTQQSRRLYGAFLDAWASWKHRPLSENDKQAGAMKQAIAAINSDLQLRPG